MGTARIIATTAVLLHMATVCAQTPYPELTIQDVSWMEGTHHYAVTNSILSPATPERPTEIGVSADVEFVSATEVRLLPGFHAGGFNSQGQFHARIDQGLGQPADLVIISPAPDGSSPYGSIEDNVVHVHKWEKVEVGLRLPLEYEEAIDRFFSHYYADNTDPDRATPYNIDALHDLNPFADDSLQIWMTLIDPNGAHRLKWGFFMREAKWASHNMLALLVEDTADPLTPYNFRFRFSPDIEGAWQISVSVKAPFTNTLDNNLLPELYSNGYTLRCETPLPDNKGNLRVNPTNKRTLQFEAGDSFLALGTNLNPTPIGSGVWSDVNNYRMQRGALDSMLQAMSQLHDVGGNFIRVFLGNGSFAPENVNVGVYDKYRDGLTCNADIPVVRGNGQFQCWAFDQVLEFARMNDLYLQLCVLPFPPIKAYQNFAWKNDGYLHRFVLPRDSLTGQYNMKRYFYLNGDTTNTSEGPMRYWKRKYKYIMARWGWSVNLPIIEHFNEIDQMLSYSSVNLTGDSQVCPDNRFYWQADSALPHVIRKWENDIAQYVRGNTISDQPVVSPLGETKKLFSVSYAGGEPDMEDALHYYAPSISPEVDLVDAHKGMHNSWDLHTNLSQVDGYRDLTSLSGQKKPFNHGEFTHYTGISGWNGEIESLFHNYWISFHNELWASAFSGRYVAGSSWIWGSVFWWRHTVGQPPTDANNFEQQGPFTKALGGLNNLDLGLNTPIPIKNRRSHHHFKPLADLLAHPSWTAYDFFNSDYSAHTYYDETNQNLIDSYYLKSLDSTVAIGWVHNRNAWIKNYYYFKNTDTTQNLLGCLAPIDTAIVLGGFLRDTLYHITWFPTWMNSTVVPLDTVQRTTLAGELLLDLGTSPLGDTILHFLDTLRNDYAYIITLAPFVKSAHLEYEPSWVHNDWDFSLYPNPARDELWLRFVDDAPKTIVLLDPLGRHVRSWTRITDPLLGIALGQLARGVYTIRASNGMNSRTKKLIIH